MTTPAYAREADGYLAEPLMASAGDTSTARESFDADYFARFAPRTALDMLDQVPGFELENGGGGDSQRGFGQASANVLIDGARITSKSTSVRDQLSRIPADNVLRIDIVDGASLDLPGLSGQVANVLLAQTGGLSGQFEWNPQHRFLTNLNNLYGGSISVTGSSGIVDFTIALENDATRFGGLGPTLISDADGVLIERRETLFRFFSDRPTLTADFRIEPAPSVVANVNLSYFKRFSKSREDDTRDLVMAVDQAQRRRFDSDNYGYEIAGDLGFPFGPGQLKLIALESFDQRDATEQARLTFEDGSAPQGRRFASLTEEGERIARAEYSWPMLSLDWQASGEAAFNRLERESSFEQLDADGEFVAAPLPGSTGSVREERYDFALSAGGAITERISFQFTGGAEFSTITDRAEGGQSRSFKRPKGSLLLAWKPSHAWDFSFELSRRVGQLEFSDFLADVSIADDQQTAANALLVPQQSWDAELEIARSLGAWGNATATLFEYRISDFIDIVPLPDGSAARGNIDGARVRGASLNATIELAQIGWNGARLDFDGTWRRTRLTDPVDGARRPLSSDRPSAIRVEFRHDIPQSDWAWGAIWDRDPRGRYFRVDEVGREFSGPVFASVFVENKDVLGLTVRGSLFNIAGADRTLNRTVFNGNRANGVIAFVEERRQPVGLGLNFSISGNF
ncbi:TonB-dependent receptor plug domain-containing protein [Altererythrobacter lutimaris]|uniref:TonB-dependent receptor n=1 Tax=Altererythrobacter lutimaris TaxID=2743979 RepID=A0A850HC05_9SPHN|nr:TonB-dependent receptor [Altererythrobacter lutimaris]NVE94815.1 TonB-dependent receptor [Altererythrobacter lutimaris]